MHAYTVAVFQEGKQRITSIWPIHDAEIPEKKVWGDEEEAADFLKRMNDAWAKQKPVKDN